VDTSKAINHISLCAGYGGIDLGLRRVFPTCRTVAYVEIEAFAVANLVAKMEEGELDQAPIWTNLKTLPLEAFPTGLEIISGGFPCQPFSAAGKREGDEDPRHLFPYIKNAIRTIQPRIVFLENVEGIISAKLKGDGWEDPAGTPVLLHVLRELERVGYKSTAGVFSATEVGATHQRKRVFILARKNEGSLVPADDCRNRVSLGEIGERATKELADTGGTGCKGSKWERETGEERQPDRHIAECGSSLADSDDSGRVEDWITSQLRTSGVKQSSCYRWPSRPGEAQQEWEEPRVVGDAKDERTLAGPGSRKSVCGSGFQATENKRREGEAERRDMGHNFNHSSEESDPRVVGNPECGRRESGNGGRPAAEELGSGREQAAGRIQAKHEIKSQLGGTVDGTTSGLDPTANRVDRLRLLGNGVVPDTCEVAFRTLYKELVDGNNNSSGSGI